jgi:hypothetical protein
MNGKSPGLPRFFIRVSLAAVISLCLGSCSGLLKQADLAAFVETGLTNVLVRSESYTPGSASLNCVPSGKTITCSVEIINPKSFDVSYSLGWNSGDALFTTRPTTSPPAISPTNLSFAFVLTAAAAEHKTITFSLGKYVAALNKTYDPETFSVLCNSPPDPAARVTAAVEHSTQLSALAVLLPSEIIDDDLSQLRITWTKEGENSGTTATYAISSLKNPPSPSPFTGSYDCYFRSSDTQASFGYTYSVVVIDLSGQESSAASSVSRANYFPLNYDVNGGGGSLPDSADYRFGDTVTVASGSGLHSGSYSFSTWNTAANGSGTTYHPGDTFSMPTDEITLYARYAGTLTISFQIAGIQTLSFSPSSLTVKQDSLPLTVSCANEALKSGGTNWTWYLDGTDSGQTGYSFSLASGVAVGQYNLSCSVIYDGVAYSGSCKITVTQ